MAIRHLALSQPSMPAMAAATVEAGPPLAQGGAYRWSTRVMDRDPGV
jgi:hypothetical protein